MTARCASLPRVRLRVFGFDYRLAPEHPSLRRWTTSWPQSLSCGAAASAGPWTPGVGLSPAIPRGRRWRWPPDAAARMLAAAPAAAALFYGCYAPVFDTSSHQAFGDGYLLTSVNMRWYWRNYLADAFDAPPPEAAPLDGNLSGLPPLYLAAAGLDPLRDDTTRLAVRLAEAGVEFRYDHVPGVVHGCLRMSRRLAPAKTMITAASAMLAGALVT